MSDVEGGGGGGGDGVRTQLAHLCAGLPLNPLPDPASPRDPQVPHAPVRNISGLSHRDRKQCVVNALRYFPPEHHPTLAAEFADELRLYGHIYMYRFRPTVRMRSYHIEEYPCRSKHAAAIMLMIMNNLDETVAQFPHELVTYGGNGQVFSNWAQFLLTMHYLSTMTDEQTLVMYSGHPLGLFPSSRRAPRLVITNGMMIPNYSSRETYDKLFALGVTMYGQMTAGSYCYIGPQGIVHGTTITLLNAGRKYLGANDLRGKVFVTSGLGGMSGAQGKASVISGCIGVIAEINPSALHKRHSQGWITEVLTDLDKCLERIRQARRDGEVVSIGYLGNVVSLWEKLVEEHRVTGERLVELGSDQTSCHNPYNGGYYPVQLTFEESEEMMKRDPEQFKSLVQESLRRQVRAINYLAESAGVHFWDYGNAFLLEAHRAGAEVGGGSSGGESDGMSPTFRYPSYVQDIMGDIFSMGFGPFRWVCTSGKPSDLALTDRLSAAVLTRILTRAEAAMPAESGAQYEDNIKWIESAGAHKLVVGSQARILYSDHWGRTQLALAFNEAVRTGEISAPVVISRDHHDVSGTDSPYRETSNITDGSAFTADMAVQNCIGDASRGATWVALHNGGGVGWGEVINGGFGLLLDGGDTAASTCRDMLTWDVNNGVSRRCWSGSDVARRAVLRVMAEVPALRVTLPHPVGDSDTRTHAALDEGTRF